MFQDSIRSMHDLQANYSELAEIAKRKGPIIIENNNRHETVLIDFIQYQKFCEYQQRCCIDEKLAEAEAEAACPNTKWIPHEEFWGNLRNRYGV